LVYNIILKEAVILNSLISNKVYFLLLYKINLKPSLNPLSYYKVKLINKVLIILLKAYALSFT
jgi:hypothetical protein